MAEAGMSPGTILGRHKTTSYEPVPKHDFELVFDISDHTCLNAGQHEGMPPLARHLLTQTSHRLCQQV